MRFTSILAGAALIAGLGFLNTTPANALTVDTTPTSEEIDFDDPLVFGGTGGGGTGSLDGNMEFVDVGNDGYFAWAAENTSPFGFLTGIGFFLPDSWNAFVDGSDLKVTDNDGGGATTWTMTLFYAIDVLDCVSMTCGTGLTQYTGMELVIDEFFPGLFTVDFGACLGSNCTGGGTPSDGIAVGDTGGFILFFDRTGGTGDLSAMFVNGTEGTSFLDGDGNFWCARWRSTGSDNKDSDVACGSTSPPPPRVPEPGTLGLLGAGLLAIGALYRRRHSA